MEKEKGQGGNGQSGEYVGDATKEEPFSPEEGISGAKHDTETGQDKADGGHGGVHKVFGHDVNDIFGADKAGLQETKTSLHEKDQEGSKQNPNGVYGGNDLFAFLGEGGLGKNQQTDNEGDIQDTSYVANLCCCSHKIFLQSL